jgi:hypothetical protein
MWIVEEHFKVRLGGNVFVDVPRLVVYKGQTLFTLRRNDRNGELGIFFELLDATGEHVASVKRNQIYQTKAGANLYEMKDLGDVCWLGELATDGLVCNICRTSGIPVELDVSVRLHTPDGFLFNATPTAIEIPWPQGITLRESTIENRPVGIEIINCHQISIG